MGHLTINQREQLLVERGKRFVELLDPFVGEEVGLPAGRCLAHDPGADVESDAINSPRDGE
jgi:hypothetical protein